MACADCLRRTWLLGRLTGHLDQVRDRIDELLELDDDRLIAAAAGAHATDVRHARERFDAGAQRERCAGLGVESVCRCDPAYPPPLRALSAPPAVLHVIGGVPRLAMLLGDQPVALVGARQPSPYGRSVARSLGRSLGAAAVTVVSGMALGIDSCAHQGALDADAPTIAVLPAGAERAYPKAARHLHRRIPERGALVSELAPGAQIRRWTFPARNRIIAAMSAMTIVVQGRTGSGSLVTARWAADLKRSVGAVPGEITSPLSAGPHRLLRGGAKLVGSAQDVLDGLFGAGEREIPAARREVLTPALRRVLDAIADGHDAWAASQRAGLDVDAGLAALASLELGGWLRREPGGRFSVVL